MKVLAFDTAMGACSVAVVVDGDLVAHHFEEQPRGHAETLMPAISRVLGEAQLNVGDFDRLGITAGPGTFTGVRVGLASARALVLGTQVKTGSVSTLHALARGMRASDEIGAAPSDLVVPVCDARRGEVYFQLFSADAEARSDPLVLPPEEAAAAIARELRPDENAWIFGSGAPLVGDVSRDDRLQIAATKRVPHPDAHFVALLVGEMSEAELGVPVPIYLRAPDAKLPKS